MGPGCYCVEVGEKGGMGDLGSLFGFYWGFSRASKILLGDMLCS